MLVVDDEEVVLDVIKSALKKSRLEVTVVTTAEQAFIELDKQAFGAVLADKNLPGQSGLEVIKQARTRNPYCACLVMTGYPNLESVVEALRLGASDYVEKPFTDVGLMVQRLEAAMAHQRVAFERAALADALRASEQTLRAREKDLFKHRTELEVFQTVVDLKIEEATRELNIQNARLTSHTLELEEKLGGRQQKTRQLADALLKLSSELDEAIGEEDLERLRSRVRDVTRRMAIEAESLKDGAA